MPRVARDFVVAEFDPLEAAWVDDARCGHSKNGEDVRARLAAQGACVSAADGLEENGDNKDRDDIHDLDHRVDRRTGGVFIRIANGVAGDPRLVRLAVLSAMVTFLD